MKGRACVRTWRVCAATIAILALAVVLAGCAAPGGAGADDNGKSGTELTEVYGRWCTGIKSDVTIDEGTFDCALFVVLEYPFYEGYMCARINEDGEWYWRTVSGNRGLIVEADTQYVVVAIQQVLHNGEGDMEWVPPEYNGEPEHIAFKFALDGSSLTVLMDQDQDREYEEDQFFDHEAVIDWSRDVKTVLAKEPATLTVTGTITLDPTYYYYNGVDPDTLDVALLSEQGDFDYGLEVDHSASYPVLHDVTSQVVYSISNVRPGVYFVGASIRWDTEPEYDPEANWVGSYGWNLNPFDDPPLAPIFSGQTTLNFTAGGID